MTDIESTAAALAEYMQATNDAIDSLTRLTDVISIRLDRLENQ